VFASTHPGCGSESWGSFGSAGVATTIAAASTPASRTHRAPLVPNETANRRRRYGNARRRQMIALATTSPPRSSSNVATTSTVASSANAAAPQSSGCARPSGDRDGVQRQQQRRGRVGVRDQVDERSHGVATIFPGPVLSRGYRRSVHGSGVSMDTTAAALGCTIEAGRIVRIDVVVDPDHLRGLDVVMEAYTRPARSSRRLAAAFAAAAGCSSTTAIWISPSSVFTRASVASSSAVRMRSRT